jgi:hypothetical protein
MLAARQAGKSQVAAALALRVALLTPRALVLLLSPSLRQSAELFRKVLDLFGALRRPVGVRAESALRLELVNGSRVLSLPESERTVRGFSAVDLLIADEASRISDDLYHAVRPMLAVSGGALVALSTPFGRRGWFFRAWDEGPGWRRVRVRAEECPRIEAAFLAEERTTLGERYYSQEYACEFVAAEGQVFDPEAIRRAFDDTIQPLFPEAQNVGPAGAGPPVTPRPGRIPPLSERPRW